MNLFARRRVARAEQARWAFAAKFSKQEFSLMQKKLLAAAVAAVSLVGMSAAASACPNGYKSVWIQGNHVCMLDASASNNLASPDGGGSKYKKLKVKKYKQLRNH